MPHRGAPNFTSSEVQILPEVDGDELLLHLCDLHRRVERCLRRTQPSPIFREAAFPGNRGHFALTHFTLKLLSNFNFNFDNVYIDIEQNWFDTQAT